MRLNPLWDLFFATALLAKCTWYTVERPSEHGVSKVRQFSFYTGLLLATVILVGPLPHLAVRNFTAHMIQHVGLMMLIAPLIVLGSPIKVAATSRFPILRKIFLGIGRNLLVRQLFRPQVGFAIFIAVLITTHFSPLANKGMVNPNVHIFELVLFLVGGFIYYYPVLEGNPHPFHVPYFVRVLSLFAMMLPETMTGFFLYSGNSLLHDVPSNISRTMAMSEQHAGGAIMWAMGMLIDTTWIALAAYDWFQSEKRLSETLDG
jgi:putative copper resistance protein D